MEERAMVVSVIVGLFLVFGDTMTEVGLDWRGVIVDACTAMTGQGAYE